HVPALPDRVGRRLHRRALGRGEVRVLVQRGQPLRRRGTVGRIAGRQGIDLRLDRERRGGPLHEVDGRGRVLRVLGDDPRTSADLAGDERLVVPPPRERGGQLTGGHVQRPPEVVLRLPHWAAPH